MSDAKVEDWGPTYEELLKHAKARLKAARRAVRNCQDEVKYYEKLLKEHYAGQQQMEVSQ